jgi:hypothetical protein
MRTALPKNRRQGTRVRGRGTGVQLNVRLLLVAALAVVCLTAASAQSPESATTPVPAPDPGYGLYYHDSQAAPAFANRWGYHDGWSEGRHDRNHGDTFTPEEKEHYQEPPEHGGHPGMTRNQYAKQYRSAYAHGYLHGSRI